MCEGGKRTIVLRDNMSILKMTLVSKMMGEGNFSSRGGTGRCWSGLRAFEEDFHPRCKIGTIPLGCAGPGGAWDM